MLAWRDEFIRVLHRRHPEEQPVNDLALTAIDLEQSAPENATDQVETEAPTEAPARVYLHPEQLAMIQTPEALPVPVLQRSVLRVSYVPAIMPGKWFNRWHERFGDRVQLAEVPVREARGLDSLHQDLCLIDPAINPAAGSFVDSVAGSAAGSAEEGTAVSEVPAEVSAEATEHAPIERKDVPENPFAHMSIVRPTANLQAPTARSTTASASTRNCPWLFCRWTMCSPCLMRCLWRSLPKSSCCSPPPIFPPMRKSPAHGVRVPVASCPKV